MKIFIIASTQFYPRVAGVIKVLQDMGHEVTPPIGYGDPVGDPGVEAELAEHSTEEEYAAWKASLMRQGLGAVEVSDAVLALNFDKADKENHIGGSVFAEMITAFYLRKKIFLYNSIPSNMLRDEIRGLSPIILDGDLSLVR